MNNNFDYLTQNEKLSKFNRFFTDRYRSLVGDYNYVDVTEEMENFGIDIGKLVETIDEFRADYNGNKKESLYHRLDSMYILTIPNYKITSRLIANREIIESMTIIHNWIIAGVIARKN